MAKSAEDMRERASRGSFLACKREQEEGAKDALYKREGGCGETKCESDETNPRGR